MRENNELDVEEEQNAQIAPDSQAMPLSATTPAVSPLDTSVNSLRLDLSGKTSKPLKRRRMIGNLDNTLDGLVAKRSDVDPNSKRYQTESEAIELPDDETEMKRLETDPDVSTRMCSICGYQGKWVSEMIRHKRVHTSERPFKCKFCNRTSKWKADLIRHVAKTHGIRVVSKYSRSKAFDSQADQQIEERKLNFASKKKDFNNNKSDPIMQRPPTSVFNFAPAFPTKFGNALSSPLFAATKSPAPMIYKCSACAFEHDSMEVLVNHLSLVHELSPFECQRCNIKFANVQLVSAHCAQMGSTCTPLQIKINFQISGANIIQPARSEGLLTVSTSSNTNGNSANLMQSLASNDSDTSSSSAPSSCASSSNTDYELSTQPGLLSLNACPECPYRTPNAQKLAIHRLGHQIPKGLFNYKCVFCNWFAKKKSAIEKHMQVHTSKPSQFMAEVERNLITPMTTSTSINSSIPSLIGGGASAPSQQANLITPLAAAPSSTANAFGLLSAFYNAGTSFLPNTSPIAPTPSMPDVSAFKELTTNPLLAFSLCSLLKDLNSQQTQQIPSFCPINTSNGLLSSAMAATRFNAFDHSNLNSF